ncbi:MAG: DUF420 domain-containing protein [Rhodothermales bacterium]|nr:DUF420 domain-containing protein [Rhodothermales bacterium]
MFESSRAGDGAIRTILLASAAASGFLIWLIYFNEPAAGEAVDVSFLPAVNALLNSLSALCLLIGYVFIRRRNIQMHRRFMLGAFVFSGLFLVSYLIYHYHHGDTPFTGVGFIRPVYFSILISHIALSIAVLPLALITLFFALKGRFDRHPRIARITLPLWLYVSVTGVLVFVLLRVYS